MTINNDWIHDVMSLKYHGGFRLERVVEEIFEQHGVINAGKAIDESGNEYEIIDPIKHYCFDGSERCRQGSGVSPATLRDNKHFLHDDFFEAMDMAQILDDAFYHIPQPNGKSDPPDGLYIQYGEIAKVECKSSQNNKFRFNNTYPSSETVYIFSSKMHNKTRVALGWHLTNDEDPAIFEDYVHEAIKRFDTEMKEMSFRMGRNFKAFARKQFDVVDHIDFIELAERKELHVDVINYLDMRLNNSGKNGNLVSEKHKYTCGKNITVDCPQEEKVN